MIPFFRKIRKKIADDNKPMKYMRYAVGEILLVVIGILIALQINNWNEDRKIEKKIKSFFTEIQIDLEKDILRANEILDSFIYFDSIETRILSDKITYDDVKIRNSTTRLIYYYNDFVTNTNGYEGLMRNVDDLPELYTPIINDLNKIYIINKTTLNVCNKRFQNTVYNNLDNLRNKDWSIHYWQDETNEAMINYFLSDTYKKEIINWMNDYRDLFDITIKYKVDAIDAYKKIAKLIESEKKLPEYVNYSLNNPEILTQLAGHYQPKKHNQHLLDELDFSVQKNQFFIGNIETKIELIWHKNLLFFVKGMLETGTYNFDISNDGQITFSYKWRGHLNHWTKTTNSKN